MTPRGVVRGIRIALGVMLAIEGFKMVATGWILGIISIVIVIVLRNSRYAPAAIVLMVLGIGIVGFRGELAQAIDLGFTLPPITLFKPVEIWQGMALAGFAQVALAGEPCMIADEFLLGWFNTG